MSTQTQSQTETRDQAGKSTMKAVRVHAFGGNDALRYEDVPRPASGAGEVLIKVHASSVNPADHKMASGLFGPMPLPLTLGLDFSGTVEALGTGVTKWKIGDAVFGTSLGSFAEYRVSPQDQLAAKPAGLDHVKAATLPVASLTAWKALFVTGRVQAGQKVLIQGGAGGVGGYAIQLAKDKGAFVAATASAGNQAYLKELGADLAIDYASTRFEDVVKDADLVLDTQGGEIQARSFRALKKGGMLVSIVQPPSQEEAARYGVRAEVIRNDMNPEALEYVAKLAVAGKLRIEIATELTLSEIGKAFELNKTGHTRGKIALRVA
jgi:NADPH:quinone reductase-like Zn-dependent oxidoreductase